MQTVRIHFHASTGSEQTRGWLKRVTAVDTTKTNGYAFVEDVIRDGENDLPLGAVVVEQYPTGSVKQGGKAGCAYRVGRRGARCVRQLPELAHRVSQLS